MTLRVGIIGCGDIYDYHHRAWNTVPDCEISGIYDADKERGRVIAAQYGGVRLHSTLQELLETANVVDICTPPDSHLEIATDAAGAGCHAIIEKPVVQTPAEWEALEGVYAQSDLKLGALHNQKYFNVNQRALKWLQDGKIGEVISIHDQYLVTPGNEWMLGLEGHWSHSMPGGRWSETLPHNLYLLHSFAGSLDLENVTVVAGDAALPGARAEEVLVTLKGSGRLATIHFSGRCELDRRMMTIVGTEGIIEVVPPGRVATYSRLRASRWGKVLGLSFVSAAIKLTQAIPDRASFVADRLAKRDAHGRAIAAYAEYVRGEAPNPTPAAEIDYAVRMSTAISTAIAEALAS